MTPDKIREVLAIYKKKFEELNISQKKSADNCLVASNSQCLAHCHAMINQIEIFLNENRLDKSFRWLGFIQGCFWKTGIYTLEELKNHNRLKYDLGGF